LQNVDIFIIPVLFPFYPVSFLPVFRTFMQHPLKPL
jgi:hypothetical protein